MRALATGLMFRAPGPSRSGRRIAAAAASPPRDGHRPPVRAARPPAPRLRPARQGTPSPFRFGRDRRHTQSPLAQRCTAARPAPVRPRPRLDRTAPGNRAKEPTPPASQRASGPARAGKRRTPATRRPAANHSVTLDRGLGDRWAASTLHARRQPIGPCRNPRSGPRSPPTPSTRPLPTPEPHPVASSVHRRTTSFPPRRSELAWCQCGTALTASNQVDASAMAEATCNPCTIRVTTASGRLVPDPEPPLSPAL